jgi:hypothetical protein
MGAGAQHDLLWVGFEVIPFKWESNEVHLRLFWGSLA